MGVEEGLCLVVVEVKTIMTVLVKKLPEWGLRRSESVFVEQGEIYTALFDINSRTGEDEGTHSDNGESYNFHFCFVFLGFRMGTVMF